MREIYSKDGSIKEYDSVKAYLERDEFVSREPYFNI